MAKKSLGRGLGDILGEVAEAYEKEMPQNSVIDLQIDQIRPNPYQPRKYFDEQSLKELADSIKEHGLLQPVVVIEDIDGFMLIAGERRLRASKMAGLSKIKAVVAQVDRSKYREFALIENIQRENLTPLELARSYKELIEEYGITHEELARIIKKSRAHVSNTLRLLSLSEYARKALEEGKITAGHAKVLVGVEEEEQKVLVDSIVGQRLSVRDVERLQSTKRPRKKEEQEKFDLKDIVHKLKALGFEASEKENRISIKFTNRNDIDKFLNFLK